jgi:hypothetical protein
MRLFVVAVSPPENFPSMSSVGKRRRPPAWSGITPAATVGVYRPLSSLAGEHIFNVDMEASFLGVSAASRGFTSLTWLGERM